ncbi:MAG: hypothetical protein HY962_17850 [Ignavibacteriae bacterium]|nr:hypothetical protein [Ignavibacteriota bacterium]
MRRGFSLVFLLLMACTCEGIYAATWYVNSSTGDDVTGNGSAGAPWRTITKGISMAANGDIIDITGTFTGEGSATTGISFNKRVTIQGHGAGVTIVQAAATRNTANRRVFSVDLGGLANVAYLKSLTVRYGRHTSGTYGAGGITINNGTLNVDGCSIEENDLAVSSSTYYGGGGIMVHDYGKLIMTNSSIRNNTASIALYGAAGVYFHSYYAEAPGSFTNCTISGNAATYTYSFDFDKDYAGVAGGISNWWSNGLTLTNCTVSHNSTTNDAGGLLLSRSTTLTNCTIAHNSAGDKGGGVVMYGSNMVTMKNTILAENSSVNETTSKDFSRYNNTGSVVDNGYNIVEYSTYSFAAAGDLTGNQANLNLSGTLEINYATNGVYTLKLSSGSVAINAGATGTNGSVSVPTTDERGAPRNGATDMGAYEYWDDNGTMPVELTTFTAHRVFDRVTLTWTTATERNNLGFQVQRRRNMDWTDLCFIPGAGTSNHTRTYTYVDQPDDAHAGHLAYRLIQRDRDGTETYSDVVELAADRLAATSLEQNSPNPFMPSTQIRFTLPEPSYVTLVVTDALGRIVATPALGLYDAGTHTARFEAAHLPVGIYNYTLTTPAGVTTRQCILAR